MNSTNKLIAISTASVVVATSVVTAGITKHIVNPPDKEPTSVKEDISKNMVVKENIEEKLVEINKKNANLVVYEVKRSPYSSQITEGKWLPITVKLSTTYSYSVVLDLSKSTIYSIGNEYYVAVNLGNVRLHEIAIDKPEILTDLTILSQLRGESISEIQSYAIDQAYESIDKSIDKDLKSKSDTIKSNIQSKLQSIYNIPHVHVVVEGDLQWE